MASTSNAATSPTNPKRDGRTQSDEPRQHDRIANASKPSSSRMLLVRKPANADEIKSTSATSDQRDFINVGGDGGNSIVSEGSRTRQPDRTSEFNESNDGASGDDDGAGDKMAANNENSTSTNTKSRRRERKNKRGPRDRDRDADSASRRNKMKESRVDHAPTPSFIKLQ